MRLEDLLRELSDLVHGVEVVGDQAAEVQLFSDAGDLRIRIQLGPAFPFQLPRVFLCEEGVPASPPQFDAGLCWHDDSGLVDHSNPVGVLRHTLERVRELLDASLHEQEWPDRMGEYETYWAVRSGSGAHVVVPVVSCVTPLAPGPMEHMFVPGGWKEAVGLLVPMKPTALPYPEDHLSMRWVRSELLKHVSSAVRRQLRGLLGQRFVPLLVFQVPRPNGLPLLLGVRFQKSRDGRHPFLRGAQTGRVESVRTYNFDGDFLRKRGGASMELKSKTVAVVGCGSVGGQITLDLARSGVGKLILIDPDVLSPENTFRHVLGLGMPWISKVEQLGLNMTLSFPGVQVQPIRSTFEAASPMLDLSKIDAIVVAVDRPSSVQATNHAARAAGVPTVVHAWLEAYGIASHVLRVHPDRPGCFECLVRNPEDGSLIDNRAHLAASGQDFTKDQAGCGGRYVEFGAVHATRTALLAVEETIRGLRGNRSGGLTTWRGDFESFDAAGFKQSDLSKEWPVEQTILRLSSDQIVVETCPVCG